MKGFLEEYGIVIVESIAGVLIIGILYGIINYFSGIEGLGSLIMNKIFGG